MFSGWSRFDRKKIHNIITLNRVIEILNKNDVIQLTAAPVVNNIIDDVQVLGTRL